MPQLNPEFFASQIFWLFLAFSILYFFVSRFFIPLVEKNIRSRESKIASNIEYSKDVLESCKFDKDTIKETLETAKNQAFIEKTNAAKSAELFIKEEIAKLELELSAKSAVESEKLQRYKNSLMKDSESISEKISVDILNKFSEIHKFNIN